MFIGRALDLCTMVDLPGCYLSFTLTFSDSTCIAAGWWWRGCPTYAGGAGLQSRCAMHFCAEGGAALRTEKALHGMDHMTWLVLYGPYDQHRNEPIVAVCTQFLMACFVD